MVRWPLYLLAAPSADPIREEVMERVEKGDLLQQQKFSHQP